MTQLFAEAGRQGPVPSASMPLTIPTHKSRNILERLRRSLPGGDTRSATFFEPHPLVIGRGEGCRIEDVDGNKFLDFNHNYTSLIHGYSHPQLVRAAERETGQGTAFAAPLMAQAELAERIARRIESVEHVRFTNSGTEAVMMAVRAARALTGRDRIIKPEGGYHGSWEQLPMSDTVKHGSRNGSAVSSDSALGSGIPRAVRDLVTMVPFNDPQALRAAMAEKGQEVAAIILEPVLGEGMIPASPEFLMAAREEADKAGAILIFDEVVTGRLEVGGYQSRTDVRPDLTVLGKVIGGGYPVGAFGGPIDLMSAFDPRRSDSVSHSGTFNGNPVTMACGAVALDLLTADEIGRLNGFGRKLADGIQAAFDAAGLIGTVSEVGSLMHLVFDHKGPLKNFADVNLHSPTLATFHLACINNGLWLAPRGIIALSTPMDEAVIAEAIERFGKAADQTSTWLASSN